PPSRPGGATPDVVATPPRAPSPETRRLAILAFAGLGPPPERLRDTPLYALRVMSRKSVLRQELAVARKHHSPDRPVYEEALQAAAAGALLRGRVLLALMLGAVRGVLASYPLA